MEKPLAMTTLGRFKMVTQNQFKMTMSARAIDHPRVDCSYSQINPVFEILYGLGSRRTNESESLIDHVMKIFLGEIEGWSI